MLGRGIEMDFEETNTATAGLTPSTRRVTRLTRRLTATLLAPLALAVGLLLMPGAHPATPDRAQAAADAAATPDLRATATRTAELAEISALRTQVAHLPVCTSPTPTATPTPMQTATPVPPVPAGTAIAYGADWSVTIASLSPMPAPTGLKPNGQYLRVNLKIENLSARPKFAPYDEWRLVNAADRGFSVDIAATQAVSGSQWVVLDGKSAEFAIVFDVSPDSGSAFILESAKQPAFRVALTMETRG